MKLKISSFILIAFISLAESSDNYYKLDDYDSSYRLLKDKPLPPPKLRDLNTYSKGRPAREKKEMDYSRREIPVPQSRPSQINENYDYERNNILINQQALDRLNGTIYKEKQKHFLFLGLNSGSNLFSIVTQYDAKKHISIELKAKIGYLYYFYKNNAFRIYANVGTSFPLYKEIPLDVIFSGNIDFLIDFYVIDFYIGVGYGGEYFIKEKFISHGVNINLGLSKSFGNHQLEFGIALPFYYIFTKNDKILNHNIDFILGYNYKF
ncbi:MAG: hypothetical protein K2P17_01800 [Helicobacteraceae bacterium]|nr:hypothetical protein [Helicobacteraceae bacterium]